VGRARLCEGCGCALCRSCRPHVVFVPVVADAHTSPRAATDSNAVAASASLAATAAGPAATTSLLTSRSAVLSPAGAASSLQLLHEWQSARYRPARICPECLLDRAAEELVRETSASLRAGVGSGTPGAAAGLSSRSASGVLGVTASVSPAAGSSDASPTPCPGFVVIPDSGAHACLVPAPAAAALMARLASQLLLKPPDPGGPLLLHSLKGWEWPVLARLLAGPLKPLQNAVTTVPPIIPQPVPSALGGQRTREITGSTAWSTSAADSTATTDGRDSRAITADTPTVVVADASEIRPRQRQASGSDGVSVTDSTDSTTRPISLEVTSASAALQSNGLHVSTRPQDGFVRLDSGGSDNDPATAADPAGTTRPPAATTDGINLDGAASKSRPPASATAASAASRRSSTGAGLPLPVSSSASVVHANHALRGHQYSYAALTHASSPCDSYIHADGRVVLPSSRVHPAAVVRAALRNATSLLEYMTLLQVSRILK
jgi:hypothetical protein